jgi:predicted DNA-binding transcriptional regulator AlpA
MTIKQQRPGVATRGDVDTVGTVMNGTANHHNGVSTDETPQSATAGPNTPNTLLLWGWPVIISVTGIARRTLERELAAGRFPKPIRRVGRRPYWRPEDVRRWAAGGRP